MVARSPWPTSLNRLSARASLITRSADATRRDRATSRAMPAAMAAHIVIGRRAGVVGAGGPGDGRRWGAGTGSESSERPAAGLFGIATVVVVAGDDPFMSGVPSNTMRRNDHAIEAAWGINRRSARGAWAGLGEPELVASHLDVTMNLGHEVDNGVEPLLGPETVSKFQCDRLTVQVGVEVQ